MPKCSNCGYTAPQGATVCPSCRSVLKPAKEATAPFSVARGGSGSLFEPRGFLKYADLMSNDELYKAAICKLNGISVAKDVDEAMEMFRILAFRGHLDSMYKLAELLLQKGGDDNRQLAVRWLKNAASLGHTPSKTKLALEKDVTIPEQKNERLQNYGGSDLENAVKRALESVVTVTCVYTKKYSMGSGYIVEGGYVITNAHVVGENPQYIEAKFEPSVDPKGYALAPIAIAPGYDVAVLRFVGLADEKFTRRTNNFSFRETDTKYGEDVYTIGNPLGVGLSVTKGVVSCPRRKYNFKDLSECIQTDMTINHGNSGGALLDMNNNVVAMMTFSDSRAEGGMGMGVLASDIVKVLNQVKSKFEKGWN